MADTLKVTRLADFTGGITRHDLDRSPGVGTRFKDIDISRSESYIEASKLPSADTLPDDTSEKIWGMTFTPGGDLYAVGMNDAEDAVKVLKLTSAGEKDPGDWQNFYVGSASLRDYEGERSNIVYNELTNGEERLYFYAGAGDEIHNIGDIGEVGFQQTFDTSTTDADPGSGKFRLNNSVYSSVTKIYVDLLDAVSQDKTTFLDNIDEGMVRITQNTDSSVYILFAIDGRSTPSGYRKFAVRFIESSGTLPTTTAGCRLFFYDLATSTELSSFFRLPMERIDGEVYIGQGREIARVDDDDVYTAPAFTLPGGWKVADFVEFEDQIAILGVQDADFSNRGEPFHGSCKVFYWDKENTTGTLSEVDIPVGGPLAITVFNNLVTVFCTQDSRLYIYAIQSLNPVLIKDTDCAPASLDNGGTAQAFLVEPEGVYINSHTLYFGLAGSGDRSGIYSLGRSSTRSPLALSQIYSADGTASDGSAYTFSASGAGNNLYWSLSKNEEAGSSVFTEEMIRLEYLNDPNHSLNAIYESVLIDANIPDSLKEWVGILVHAKSMPSSGCQIRVDAKVDNAPAFTGDVLSNVRTGSTATVTMHNKHGFETGDSIVISGAIETEFNGTFTITATGETTFTYSVTGTPDTPATGTIRAFRSEDVLTTANDQSSYDNTTGDRFWYRQWRNLIGRKLQIRVHITSDGTNTPQLYGFSVLSRDLSII